MKKIYSSMQDLHSLKLSLLFPGFIIGSGVGLLIVLYRLSLSTGYELLIDIISYCRESFLLIILWFLVLIIIAYIVSLLVNNEPLISGSGIPQLEGELSGKIDSTWWRVLFNKFVGGFLSSFSGLALGREGPSIQLGAMFAKGLSKFFLCSKTEERYLLTCGASAGLAAAFHAPLAGVMFALEEVHKHFSAPLLICVTISSVSADYIMSWLLGVEPIFDFGSGSGNAIPLNHLWLIILLGVILGIAGAVYNKLLLFVQNLFNKSNTSTFKKLLVPFLLAGILALLSPSLLGSGDNYVDLLINENLSVYTMLFLLVGKYIFSIICFGSGAPGGIFFPLLVTGSLIGGLFAKIAIVFLNVEPNYFQTFILLAMAGYFTAIVRAPVTGIILIFEMSGSLEQLISITTVCIIAYIVADLLRSKPIYESLLENLLKKRNFPVHQGVGEKVLLAFVINMDSHLDNRQVKEIDWPKNCLIVSLYRENKEFIPRGDTYLKASDEIVIMCDEKDEGYIYDTISSLII